MKHTKKRAILSAVAMLVVSAVALSSATFAWFSAGTSVGVDQIQASVSNSNGSILISATGAVNTWKTQLTLLDLQNAGTNLLPSTLVPVSVTLASQQVIGGSITDAVFKSTGITTTGFVKYTAYVKAVTADCTVTITPQFASSAAFCYGGVIQGTNSLLLNGTSAKTYYPIDKPVTTVSDINTNDIVDPAEAAAGDLGTITAPATISTGSISLAMTADQVYTIIVYVWAEGQDAACRGIVPLTSTQMTLTIVKV